MAILKASDFNTKPLSSGEKPKGYVETYEYSAGGSIGDIVYFGKLPAGIVFTDFELVNDAAAGAEITLGFLEGGNTQSSAFLPAISLASAGKTGSAAHPISFDNDVTLVGVISGANIAGGVKLSVVTSGKGVGVA